MRLSVTDLNLIVAALRQASMANEDLARQMLAAGDRPKALRLSLFAHRCGELSDILEKGGQPSIVQAH